MTFHISAGYLFHFLLFQSPSNNLTFTILLSKQFLSKSSFKIFFTISLTIFPLQFFFHNLSFTISLSQSLSLSISLSKSSFHNLSFTIFLSQSFFHSLSIIIFLSQSFFYKLLSKENDFGTPNVGLY